MRVLEAEKVVQFQTDDNSSTHEFRDDGTFSVGAIKQAIYYGDDTPVASDTLTNLDWGAAVYDGDALLDLTDRTIPRVFEGGVYAINLFVSPDENIADGVVVQGELRSDFENTEDLFTVAEAKVATVNLPTPAINVSRVCRLSAGMSVTSVGLHRDSGSKLFYMYAIIAKICGLT